MSDPTETGRTLTFSLRPVEAAKAAHYLTVVQGVIIERAVPITAEPLILGRDAARAFYLPDENVSRSHCEVRLAGDTVLVRDLGSTNGTFVDGARVTGEQPLSLSAHLQVGRHTLKHALLTPEEVARHEQFTSDLARARRYVEALIPPPLESGPLRTQWCFVPSSVLGGDALGYHDIEGGRLAVYVLDVCGHGVASAMHSASVLNTLRSQTLPNTDFADPAQVLERLNETFPMEGHHGMYFSLFYGVIDPAQHRVRYSSAGHPPAIVVGVDPGADGRGSIRSRLAVKNPPIGTLDGRTFDASEAEFAPGSRLYAFSDGAFEILDRDGRDLGLEDLERELVAQAAAGSAGAPQRLYDAACAAAGTDLLADDFTMLLVEYASEHPH